MDTGNIVVGVANLTLAGFAIRVFCTSHRIWCPKTGVFLIAANLVFAGLNLWYGLF